MYLPAFRIMQPRKHHPINIQKFEKLNLIFGFFDPENIHKNLVKKSVLNFLAFLFFLLLQLTELFHTVANVNVVDVKKKTTWNNTPYALVETKDLDDAAKG